MTVDNVGETSIEVETTLRDVEARFADESSTGRRHEYVRKVLRLAILTGALPAGLKVTEASVIGALGVSRTPVREAFRLLEAERLIEYSPSRGVIIRGMGAPAMIEVGEMLESLEPLAAQLAATRASQEQVDLLKDSLDLMVFNASRGKWKQVTVEGIRFHKVIYEACGNVRLMNTLIELREYVRVVREDALAAPGRGPKSVAEHADLYEAIRDRDEAKAADAARRHLHNFREQAQLIDPRV